MEDIELLIKIPADIYKDIMEHNREMREGGKSAYYFEGLIQQGIPFDNTESEDKIDESNYGNTLYRGKKT